MLRSQRRYAKQSRDELRKQTKMMEGKTAFEVEHPHRANAAEGLNVMIGAGTWVARKIQRRKEEHQAIARHEHAEALRQAAAKERHRHDLDEFARTGVAPEAGWYPYPPGSPDQRWWDGRAWSGLTRSVDDDQGTAAQA